MSQHIDDPPREGLVRAFFDELDPVGIRSVADSKSPGTLFGALATFDEWAEINSAYEGHFMERVCFGAFQKTFKESGSRARIMYHHGMDQAVGNRPIGVPVVLEEREAEGIAYYEAELFDAHYCRELVPAAAAGTLGSSFRFGVVRQEFNRQARKSAHNPKGLPERSLIELRVPELGPTPFPAYAGTHTGMRSLTDSFVADRLERNGFQVSIPKAVGDSNISRAREPYSREPDENIQCTNCGLYNANDAEFCDQCGAKPSHPGGMPYQKEPDETVRCPVCDCYNEPDANYCDQCGYELPQDPSNPDPGAPGAKQSLRSAHTYRRTSRLVAETPWLLHPAALETICAIMAERRAGHTPTDAEIRERIGTRAAAEASPDGPVRVINIEGPIVPKATLMTEVSGGATVESIQAELRAAVADSTVQSILLNVDSPGGSAAMIPELAAEISAAGDVKPVTAVANTWAASAAYFLASQAGELVVTPSGSVGSIGVYTVHEDLSGQYDKEGVKPTLISAGKYKTEGNPFEPLSSEGEAYLQEQVDAIYDVFVAAVADGRGVDTQTVLDTFGQGRMVMAPQAVELGMADRVDTFTATLQRLSEAAATTAPGVSAGAAREPVAASAQLLHPDETRRGSGQLDIEEVTPAWRL